YLLHLLLKLNWITTGILLGAAFLMLPLHSRENEKKKRNESRFFQVSLYLDTILYAFLKEEKIEAAIHDAGLTLQEGTLKEAVLCCHEKLLMTTDDTSAMEESLGEIEKEFSCKRMHDIHAFMLHVEYYGGDIEKPVKLLLDDKNRWESRMKKAMEERKKKMTDIVMSVAASILICGVILYLPVLDMDISENWLIQIFALIVLMIDDVIILRAQKYLSVDWLTLRFQEEEDYYRKKMIEYKSYDEKKERKVSVITGSIALAVSIALFAFGNEWAAAIGMLVSVFLFGQHKIGRILMERTLTKEIKYAFPNWLLDLILLLQSENVQVALQKSRLHVPGVLQEELDRLLEHLEMEPESSKPYHGFLKDFSIPEVHSAMSGLYGISIGNSSKGDRQVGELIEKNLELLDIAESKRLSDAGSGMYLLFLAPVLTASFKLVMDMVILMIYFIRTPMV
ncbi:MAG: hypothetical protein IJ274_10070, partial [Lachnospiraceae bacterium]|nr:hypothetical protein [Lachnospiraceae bacterium]